MRVMGLDVGDKTIGVAISDELEISAQPLTVIRRTESLRKDLGLLVRIMEEQDVGEIVVGLPLMLDGTPGIQAEKVEAFIERLRARVKTPIMRWDERLSTSEVSRVLLADDQSRARRRDVIDKLAAAVVLQSYLDNKRVRKIREKEQEDE